MAVAALALASLVAPTPRLVYNPSNSVPIGWYWITPIAADRRARPQAGGIVLVRLPEHAADFAARRHYLPRNVPLLKTVGAVEGQQICTVGLRVYVDGVLKALALPSDSRGRPLRAWHGCRLIDAHEVFLLSTQQPDSYDGRYFGPVPASMVLGTAHRVRQERNR